MSVKYFIVYLSGDNAYLNLRIIIQIFIDIFLLNNRFDYIILKIFLSILSVFYLL